jgi:S1-C subfamily serine protease
MKRLLLLLAAIAILPGFASADSGNPGLIRINATLQTYSPAQPWERTTPRKRRGLGAVIAGNRILTTAEMIANGTYIELESADGTRTTPGTVIAIDYEANLALVTPEDPAKAPWVSGIKPLDTNGPVKIGDSVDVWQLEDNGSALRTIGTVRSVDLLSTFVSGNYFLAYEVKASMQSASSSYTLPVTCDGRLIGILTSYNSKDQISDVIAPEIVDLFLQDVADGTYTGFPSLGVATVLTEDPQFRKFLELGDELGGLYVSRILPKSSADEAGIREKDVILALDGNTIDRRGYYADERYGRLFWTNLIRGRKKVGDTLKIDILRDGERQTLDATLRRPVEPLIPAHIHDQPPAYLVKGGLVFQDLSKAYLEAFGKEWESRAPLPLLDALRNPEDYEKGRKRLVFLSRVIPTPATIGYESVSGVIVTEVNGHAIADIPSLVEAFQHPADGIHTIRIEDVPYVLYLDADASNFVDSKLLESGLPALQRLPQ